MLQEQIRLAQIGRQGLQKLRHNQQKNDLKRISEEKRSAIDHSKYIFEEYTEENFKKKIFLDKYIYSEFLKPLFEKNKDIEQTATDSLGDMLATVRQIYEFVNIKPKQYGFNKMDQDTSEQDLISEAKSLIRNHLNKKYYTLTKEEKEKKYKEEVINLSKNLVVNENLEVDSAVEHSYKTTIINDFIRKLNFPYVIECKINELFVSEMYDKFYEKDKLKDLWQVFEQQSLNISRIIALTI